MALTYGTIGHGVLEHAYENFRIGKNEGAPSQQQVKKYLSIVEKQWKAENFRPTKYMLQDLETALAFAEVILPEYFEYWRDDFKKKKWQKIEGTFNIPFEDTCLRGKMDGMFKTQGMWLFESKFKSMINEGDIVDTLSLDLQVRMYLYALWKKYGVMPSGVLYNVVRRFNLKQKKDESLQQFAKRCLIDLRDRPDWYFYRFEVVVTKKDMLEFEQELIGMVKEFCQWCDGEIPHYKNPHSCLGKYGRCQYLDACANGNLGGLAKRKVVYRELEDY
jgi:hypothetical protein